MTRVIRYNKLDLIFISIVLILKMSRVIRHKKKLNLSFIWINMLGLAFCVAQWLALR